MSDTTTTTIERPLIGPATPPWLNLDGLDELRADGSALYWRLRGLAEDLVAVLDEHRHLSARYDEVLAELEGPLAAIASDEAFGDPNGVEVWKLLHYLAGLTCMDRLFGLIGYIVEGVEGDIFYRENARFIDMRFSETGITMPSWLRDLVNEGQAAGAGQRAPIEYGPTVPAT